MKGRKTANLRKRENGEVKEREREREREKKKKRVVGVEERLTNRPNANTNTKKINKNCYTRKLKNCSA